MNNGYDVILILYSGSRPSCQDLAPKTGLQCVTHSTMFADCLYFTRKLLLIFCKYYILFGLAEKCYLVVLTVFADRDII